jgi:hypothetical protein
LIVTHATVASSAFTSFSIWAFSEASSLSPMPARTFLKSASASPSFSRRSAHTARFFSAFSEPESSYALPNST